MNSQFFAPSLLGRMAAGNFLQKFAKIAKKPWANPNHFNAKQNAENAEDTPVFSGYFATPR